MENSRAAKIYVGAVVAAATALIGAMQAWLPPMLASGGDRLVPLLAGTSFILLAGYCPICLGRNIAVNMASTVMFAMILLFPPGYAAIGAALGMAALYTLLHWPALYIAFNAAQAALTVGVAGLVFSFMGAPLGGHGIAPLQAAGVLAAAGTFFAVNSFVVTTFAVLVGSAGFVPHWKRTFGRAAIPYLSTLLLGVVAAATYSYAPIVTPILALPVVAVYRSLRNENIILRQTKETIELLADTLDQRDPYTFAHSQRVGALARRIVERLGLSPENQEVISHAARVHDLGKLGIPDALLHKAGKLDTSELEQIRKHTVIGAQIVGKLPEYKQGKEFILFHHERYDGSGRFGLHGHHIPLGARVIAVADAFDAMTSDRPYRRAMPVEEALAELERGKGTQFDPEVAQALIEVMRMEARSLREQPVLRAATATSVSASPT